MSKLIDLTGKTFNRLAVIERAENAKSGLPRWKCQCSCGNIKIVQGGHLRTKHTQSCGCIHKECQKKRLTKHGMCGTPEYRSWYHMLDRCYNPNDSEFKNYGARGITVCNEWRNGFSGFYNDMKKKPSPQYTLERIDNNKGYFKENCRWATWKEQSLNRRNNHRVKLHEWDLTITEWAQFVGLKPHVIFQRLYQKWPPAKAVFCPKRI